MIVAHRLLVSCGQHHVKHVAVCSAQGYIHGSKNTLNLILRQQITCRLPQKCPKFIFLRMQLLSDELNLYLERHCDPENELLKHINRETNLKVLMPRMLSGHYQGRLLSMISKMVSPRRILEIGTYTAYATLCLAEGLTPDGMIHTIDINTELEDVIHGNIARSGMAGKIRCYTGNAVQLIPMIDETFDLVFIDADKRNNGTYYDLVFDKLRPGGIIIVDNVLWSGKIFEAAHDRDTAEIYRFNERISADNRVEKLILPVRDGVFIIRKK